MIFINITGNLQTIHTLQYNTDQVCPVNVQGTLLVSALNPHQGGTGITSLLMRNQRHRVKVPKFTQQMGGGAGI